MSSNFIPLLVAVLLLAAGRTTFAVKTERGEVGDFTTLEHEVSGTLHILDSKTIFLQKFNYDGEGPDTVLYYYPPGAEVDAAGGGVVIPLPAEVGDDQGRFQNERYSNQDIQVTLPEGMSTCDIGVLTVWCRRARVIFGQLQVPRSTFVKNGSEPCAAIGSAEIGDIQTFEHEVSGTLHIIDSKTIYIENFNYDGQGPDTLLYSYAPGQTIDRRGGGTIIPLTQEFGDSEGRFRRSRYENENIVLTLPDGVNACDIGALTVWCRQASQIFGQIVVPRSTFADNGASPCTVIADGSGGLLKSKEEPEFDNCIPLHETLQLSWKVDSDNSQVRFQLCGCQSADVGTNQYMGFGLSGSTSRTLMFGADPTITWVDTVTGEANAVDYHLSAYTQCRAGVGACPDTVDSRGTCTNDVTDVTGSVSEGQQCVSFTKPLSTADSTCDIPIDPTNENQYIVWGVGGLGETAFKHFIRAEPTDAPLHLGRAPRDECARTNLVCRGCQPFENKKIFARESTTFQARIGPSGNERGYMGITGRAGWGIAWYINGTLIPELVVQRGETYTFLIEGGDNSNDLTNYHPFYISDSIGGGRLQNSPEDQANEVVYAGFDENGIETGVGELCKHVESPQSEVLRQNCFDLEDYTDTLSLAGSCRSGSGQPGKIVWTPDENTPDVVYYQCATHLNLGWKISVFDSETFPNVEGQDLSHAVTNTVSYLMVSIFAGFLSAFYSL